MDHHKLLIEVDIGRQEKYSEYYKVLEKGEIPRGLIDITYYITNIGDTNFIGTLKEINLSYIEPITGKIIDNHSEYPNQTFTIPNSHEKIFLYKTTIPMLIEGNGWFICILEPSGGHVVEYFTNKGNRSLGTTSWKYLFKVINKEQLEIIKLLQDIKKNSNNIYKDSTHIK